MRARASRNDAGMDLFPFMAVLICTVGALIMLLVVMVQQARVKASQPRDSVVRQQRQADELAALAQQRQEELAEYERKKRAAEQKQFKYDELKWKAELMRESYGASVANLADQRKILSHLESHARELSEQASRMQREADLIALQAKNAASEKAHQQSLQDLDAAIASAKTQLEKAKAELESQEPKYVLIPYEGPNGTTRRPVYIECLSDRVVLRPENITLIGEDFLAPLTIDNPLARALRAKREFLQDNGLIGPEDEPYPLLVVRPGAAASYAAARSAMKAWESEFGYELVEADVDLDYLDADPRLVDLLEDVVLETRGKRRMMRNAQVARRSRPRERLRPSASGGFESFGTADETFQANETDGFATGDSGQVGSRGAASPGGAGQGNGSEHGTRAGQAEHAPDGSAGRPVANRFDRGGAGGGTDASYYTSQANARGNQYNESPHPGGTGGDGGSSGGSQAPNVRAEEGTAHGGGTGGSAPTSSANPYRNGSREFVEGSPNAAVGGASSAAGRAGAAGGDAATSGAPGAAGSGGAGGTVSGPNARLQGSAFSDSIHSLADSRGSGWATPNRQPNAVGIQRPILVVCDPDSISLLPERGTKQDLKVFRHRGKVENVVDVLVTAVQDRVESWGIAGQGIYWKPVLQIRVKSEAQAAYQEMLHLLDDSGIEVTREP